MFDVVIRGGSVCDGTRAPCYHADIGIRDGKIAQIGERIEASGTIEINAAGKIIAPGFIDMHTHSDLAPFSSFIPESKVNQGVTFELTGNCGISPLPSTPETRRMIQEYYLSNLQYPTTELTAHTLDDYIKQAEALHPMTNYGMLIGHSALRGCVMGFDNRQPLKNELEKMENLLEEELSMGAFGMSLGLIYPPSAFAETDELDALARIVRKYDGILAVHIRNEGPRVFEAVEEMLGVARRSGVHLQISHLKIMTKSLWGKAQRLLEEIDVARATGVWVTCDQYPFFASSTGLTALLPKWAHAGGIGPMLERISHPDERLKKAIADELESRGGAERVMLSSTHGVEPQWEGKMVSEIAEELDLSVVDTVLSILRCCHANVHCNYFSQNEADMELILSRRDIAVASDGYNYSYDRTITKDTPHPRNFSTFPHALELAREKKLMPVEDIVYKMTALPAKLLGMKERGELHVGMCADITVFDWKQVGQAGDFNSPVRRPNGIEYVLVSGQPVLIDGALTGKRPGTVLRHGLC